VFEHNARFLFVYSGGFSRTIAKMGVQMQFPINIQYQTEFKDPRRDFRWMVTFAYPAIRDTKGKNKTKQK
jgi:hypothetical protein